MEKKKKIVIIASIAVTLLFLIGASYAYFTVSVNKENEENKRVEVTTSALARATMEMGNKITAEGVLPGYKVVKTVRVYGSGPEGSKPLNATIKLTPNVVDFSNHIEYEIYALDNPNSIDANNICSESNKQSNNNQYYDEMTCDTSNLGEKVTSGVFEGIEPVEINISVERTTDRTYYLIVKYINDENASQDQEQGKRFTIDIDFGTDIETSKLAVEYITSLATTSDEIVDDETADHNLRYIGSNPNNYVQFNNELWRVIGVMNDVADENGTIEPRVKIIRNESIGNYSWDNKANGKGSSISQYGSNDWSDSAIQEVLNNGAYYNRTRGTCPNGSDGATRSCDFSSIGLTSEAKTMISRVKWKLGGTSSNTGILASQFYGNERGATVYSGRPTEWTGEVGLMYASDYGYATSGGATFDRNGCLSMALFSWDSVVYGNCMNNDWLYTVIYSEAGSSIGQWTITLGSSRSDSVFSVSSKGGILNSYATFSEAIRPVVYLSTSTTIQSGTGSSSDPFILK